MKFFVITLAIFALPLACVSAGDKTETTSTTQPATDADNAAKTDENTENPTTAPEAEITPEAKEILDRLEKAGDKYKTLKADIDYTVVMTQLGDTDKRTGWVAFQQKTKDSPAKFRVQFATRQLGEGAAFREKEDYAFNGYWLTVAKHKIREITKYEICKKGDEVDVLTIGKGPFPIPFGQKAADVMKYCEVTTRPLEKGEPEKTSYLKLAPRKECKEDLNFTQLEMWVNDKYLPVRIVSRDKNKDITTVVFSKIETDVTLDKDVFNIPVPAGWQSHEQPLDNKQSDGSTKPDKE